MKRDSSSCRISSAKEIRRFFAESGRHVITFAGFGELGYNDRRVLLQVAIGVLADWNPAKVIVNTGTLIRLGGEHGIAGIYPIAAQLGIETSGIHPSVALGCQDTHRVSPYCKHAYFVQDQTWGGFVCGEQMSPTLRVILDVTDELVVIGGGKHAADELEAFVERRKRVRFFPAEMNRRATKQWCQRSGQTLTDYRGAAHNAWLRLQSDGEEFRQQKVDRQTTHRTK